MDYMEPAENRCGDCGDNSSTERLFEKSATATAIDMLIRSSRTPRHNRMVKAEFWYRGLKTGSSVCAEFGFSGSLHLVEGSKNFIFYFLLSWCCCAHLFNVRWMPARTYVLPYRRKQSYAEVVLTVKRTWPHSLRPTSAKSHYTAYDPNRDPRRTNATCVQETITRPKHGPKIFARYNTPIYNFVQYKLYM